MNANVMGNLRDFRRNAMLGAPLLMIALLMMLVVPMPPLMLDLFFTFNIALSLVVIMACVYAGRPLAFASFPTVLLVATLLRLALNIASTRVVLLDGHTGTDAAGRVIEAFGEFVIGGNFAVGLVVFTILIIINFIVVTKGAGRISEVSALHPRRDAGQADGDRRRSQRRCDRPKEAKRRRGDVVAEADFWFHGRCQQVRPRRCDRGHPHLVTIIGGLAIGMMQHGMAFGDAVHNYTLLTVGDGLVARIGAGAVDRRRDHGHPRIQRANMGTQLVSQLFDIHFARRHRRHVDARRHSGMPNAVFLLLGGRRRRQDMIHKRSRRPVPSRCGDRSGKRMPRRAI